LISQQAVLLFGNSVNDATVLISFKATEEIKKMWKLFQSVDAVQMEINPFVETDKGDVISVDAKLQFDDNAQFRQDDIFSLEDVSETDPREVEAAKAKLNYIPMSGNIGCLGKCTAICSTV
jgi:succinyl-CoA synthetase beta subunit